MALAAGQPATRSVHVTDARVRTSAEPTGDRDPSHLGGASPAEGHGTVLRRPRARTPSRAGLAAVGLALYAAATPAAAQVVRGRVVAERGATPIDQADVRLLDELGAEHARVVTDTAGTFYIQTPGPGRYSLEVRRIGYAATTTPVLDLALGEGVVVEVRMSVQALAVEPLVVVERRQYPSPLLREFYERAEWTEKSGRGHIFYHDNVQRYVTVPNILATIPQRQDCEPAILLDGLPAERRELEFLTADRIEGVEIYRGILEIPPAYMHASRCGVVLVWTRPLPGKPWTWKRLLVASAIALFLLLQ